MFFVIVPHPSQTFNRYGQKPGKFGHRDRRAEPSIAGIISAREVSWDGTAFSMELFGAYGMDGLRSLCRSFTLFSESVILSDRIDSDLPITERFISPEEPAVASGMIRWNDAKLTFSPAVLPTVTRSENTIEGNKIQVSYLIDIPLPPGTKEFVADIR